MKLFILQDLTTRREKWRVWTEDETGCRHVREFTNRDKALVHAGSLGIENVQVRINHGLVEDVRDTTLAEEMTR